MEGGCLHPPDDDFVLFAIIFGMFRRTSLGVCVLKRETIQDRANIGNARVAGLQTDLGLSDWQYQVAITCLYVYVYVSVSFNHWLTCSSQILHRV